MDKTNISSTNILPYENVLLSTDRTSYDDESGLFAFQPYQLYCKYKIHPISDKYRFLLKHSPGSGKTISALLAARNFLDRNQSVMIVTFNKQIFLDDMLKFSQLGFVSEFDRKRLLQSTDDNRQEIIKQLIKLFPIKLQFIGYKELYNQLFVVIDKVVHINQYLISQLVGGLIICDEMQNTYNHDDPNTWGNAITFLSVLMNDKIHCLYLSATPLNHPEEISELINLMKIQNIYRDMKKDKALQKINLIIESLQTISKNITVMDDVVRKWIKNTIINDTGSIEQQITKYMYHRLSFVPELQQDIPISEFKGTEYTSIKYIKIEQCVITSESYQQYMKDNDYLHDEEYRRHIYFDFPNKIKLQKFIQQYKQENTDIMKWSKDNKISVIQQGEYDILQGEFLKLGNIGQYSPKYERLMNGLITMSGKSFVFVNKVKLTGLHLLQSMLRSNGLVKYRDQPNQNSICFKCRKQLIKHQDEKHPFIPYTYISITGKGELDQKQQLSVFNSLSNIDGDKIQVVLGSRKITEGYNLLGINNVFVTALPFNIPKLIQVIGRAIRNKSHSNLIESKRYVNIYLLINTLPKDQSKLTIQQMDDLYVNEQKSVLFGKVTKDELDLFKKMQQYLLIQQYELLLHQCADDINLYASLYFKIEHDSKQKITNLSVDNQLRMLPFQTNEYVSDQDVQEANMSDYDLSNYYFLSIHRDIEDQLDIVIAHLLNKQNIWLLPALLDAIHNTIIIPNTETLPVDQIILQLTLSANTHIIGNYIVKMPRQVDVIDINVFQLLQHSVITNVNLTLPTNNTKSLNNIFNEIFMINKQFVDTINRGDIDLKHPKPVMAIQQLSNDDISYLFDLIFTIGSNFAIGEIWTQIKDSYRTFEQTTVICSIHQLFDSKCKQCDLSFKAYKDNVDLHWLVFAAFVYTPVFEHDLFDKVGKTTKLIGFLQNNRQVIHYDDQANIWRYTNIQIQDVYDQQIGIKTKNNFSLFDIKQKDIRGQYCTSFTTEQLNQLSMNSVKNEKATKQSICNIIMKNLFFKELNYKFNFQYRKAMIIEAENKNQ